MMKNGQRFRMVVLSAGPLWCRPAQESDPRQRSGVAKHPCGRDRIPKGASTEEDEDGTDRDLP